MIIASIIFCLWVGVGTAALLALLRQAARADAWLVEFCAESPDSRHGL